MSKQHTYSPFFSKPPKIDEVFPYTVNQVAYTLAKLKINGWTLKQAKQQLAQSHKALELGKLAINLWLYYAIHHACVKYPNASQRDIYSFATLVESFFSGFYGGFGSEAYEKERQIENQSRFLLNRLTEISISDITKAKILLLVLEDKYFHS